MTKIILAKLSLQRLNWVKVYVLINVAQLTCMMDGNNGNQYKTIPPEVHGEFESFIHSVQPPSSLGVTYEILNQNRPS